MSYFLGIDLGTTYTAAAVVRGGVVEMAELGTRSVVAPSVVLARPDGTRLIGEAAERRSSQEPMHIAREFKRRIGDSAPMLLGGVPYSAEALTSILLAWVIEKVAEVEGGPPTRIALTHPANWGEFKLDVLAQAVRLAGLGDDVVTLTEPSAAAVAYAAAERIPDDARVAVYDLGGGTFDATVLERRGAAFVEVGQPEGIDRLGGIDVDQAVLAHVSESVGAGLDQLDPEEPAVAAQLARLRRDCVDAKESLSADVDVSIPVQIGATADEVRLTRGELESMIRPTLEYTVEALRRAIASAGLTPADIHAVLLAGGSSRIPLVAQLVGAGIGRPIAVDLHPKHAVARGAALAAARAGAAPAVVPPADPAPSPVTMPPAAEPHRGPPPPGAPVHRAPQPPPAATPDGFPPPAERPTAPPRAQPTAPPRGQPAAASSYQPPVEAASYQPPAEPVSYQPPAEAPSYQPPPGAAAPDRPVREAHVPPADDAPAYSVSLDGEVGEKRGVTGVVMAGVAAIAVVVAGIVIIGRLMDDDGPGGDNASSTSTTSVTSPAGDDELTIDEWLASGDFALVNAFAAQENQLQDAVANSEDPRAHCQTALTVVEERYGDLDGDGVPSDLTAAALAAPDDLLLGSLLDWFRARATSWQRCAEGADPSVVAEAEADAVEAKSTAINRANALDDGTA